jgi:hypothetical protein
MRIILTIFAIIFVLEANSQNYVQTFDSFDKWLGQAKYDFQLLSRFDKYCRSNNLLNGPLAMIDMRGDNSWNYMKAVDLNNDGLQDIVYSGPSGGEPNIVYFYLQLDSGFEEVFNVMQGIKKVAWNGKLLDQVFTSDWGCCAAIYLTNSVYDVHYDRQNKPVFTKVFQTIEVNDELVKPTAYFANPYDFSVDNEGYKLRLAPLIDDETEYHWLDITGNTFATLKRGTKGTVLASQTDDTGRVWWYVEIDLDNNVQNCILQTNDYFPTKVIGWISSRYVTRLEN